MPDQSDWEAKAANILKSELKRQGITYAKLSRGKFSAAFMLQALAAIEVHDLRV